MQILRKGTEAAQRLGRSICPHGSHMHGGADVDSGRVRVNHRHRTAHLVSRFTTTHHHSSCSGAEGWAALLINFLNGIAGRRHHSHVRYNPWTMFFYGVTATKKPSAAPSHRG